MARRARKQTGAHKILVTQKVRQALQLRLAGLSLAEIASQCGYHSEQAVSKAIKTALRRSIQAPADELRLLEAQRLDKLLYGIWERATHHESPEDRLMYERLRLLLEELTRATMDPSEHGHLQGLSTWLETLWTRATGGQLDAITRVITIMQRRAALLGLDMPLKHAPTTPDGDDPWEGAFIWLPSKAPTPEEWREDVARLATAFDQEPLG